MGRYIEQNESRSELQQRIASELRAKAAARAKEEGSGGSDSQAPDGVEDSAYIKGTKTTTSLAPVWAIIFLAVIGLFIYFIFIASK